MHLDRLYHIGFGRSDLGENPPSTALLSGDPRRARAIAQATDGVRCIKTLNENRGLNSYLCELADGTRFCSMTTGMGGPSLSIVANEAFQVGMRRMIRVGTCGSIQEHIRAGSVAIASGAVCYQGAADDIAPPEFPAVCDPFLTVKLAQCAAELGVEHYVCLCASTDTFYEGQERVSGANPTLLRRQRGLIEELRSLNVGFFEMETATLAKMGVVYGFAAGSVCAVIADRSESEQPKLELKAQAVGDAVRVALSSLCC
ncbi:MAG: nucleoside phosphorylase [Desulfuromonadales bacterium]|jgi:uridine phosphorylase